LLPCLVKVRLQSQGHGKDKLYDGAVDCVRKIIKNEGMSAFYKVCDIGFREKKNVFWRHCLTVTLSPLFLPQGTLPPLLGIGLCVSIQFAAVEQAKGYFHKLNKGEPFTYSQFFLAGSFAGVANSIISGPVEHIRTRLQVQVTTPGKAPEYTGLVDCVKKIHSKAGLAGIYKGQVITVVREFQGYGGYFLAYELATRKLVETTGKKLSELNPLLVMLCGAMGGFGMWIPVYPIDVVKSKMQTDGFGAAAKYKGTLDCFRKTYAAEGIAGFYRGFAPCLLRAAPVNASTFLAFELTMRVLGRD